MEKSCAPDRHIPFKSGGYATVVSTIAVAGDRENPAGSKGPQSIKDVAPPPLSISNLVVGAEMRQRIDHFNMAACTMWRGPQFWRNVCVVPNNSIFELLHP